MQAVTDEVKGDFAAVKKDVDEVKGLIKDVLEEVNSTHADVRYMRTTLTAQVRTTTAHEEDIVDLQQRMARVEKKVGIVP